MIRLFIIEDHPIIVDGLKHRFRHSWEKINVAGWCNDISKFLTEIPEDSFDILILDLWLPDSDPVENLCRIKNRYPGKPIVVFTNETSTFWMKSMIEQGVKAYLNKDISKKELKTVLEKVHQGKTVMPDLQVNQTASFSNNEFLFQKYYLKPSEQSVLFRISKGETLKEIASSRSTTVSAIEKMVSKIRIRFGVKTNPELIRILLEQKLL